MNYYAAGTDRRTFLGAVGAGLLATPFAAVAQLATKPPRIGILNGDSPFHRNGVSIFKDSLDRLGYTPGRTILLEERYAPSPEMLAGSAAELAASNVSILVAFTTQPAIAAKAATSAIPIVFAVVGDPVDAGLVAMLARPGGNVTGLAAMQPDITAMQLQFLKEVMPRLARVAVLWNAGHASKRLEFKELEGPARDLHVTLVSIEVRSASDFPAAFARLNEVSANALIVLSEPLIASRGTELLDIIKRRRLPDMQQVREVPEKMGGFMSYGPNLADDYRRAANDSCRIELYRSFHKLRPA